MKACSQPREPAHEYLPNANMDTASGGPWVIVGPQEFEGISYSHSSHCLRLSTLMKGGCFESKHHRHVLTTVL
jgi:hypothetical protein